jgi:multidrug transporter EmrE-like cation transporter
VAPALRTIPVGIAYVVWSVGFVDESRAQRVNSNQRRIA